HYTTVPAQPAVESLTYWGLGDAGAWLGAPAGLLRADGSPEPGYHALRQLPREARRVQGQDLRRAAQGVLTPRGLAGHSTRGLPGESFAITTPGGGGRQELRRPRPAARSRRAAR